MADSETLYDITILGGGPAGAGATVYAARKRLNSLMITNEFGGQSNVSPEIYNWIGTPTISGSELAQNFEKHVRGYEGDYLDIIDNETVTNIEQSNEGFLVTTKKGNSYKTRGVIVGTGSSRRKLPVPGAEKFENKGVVYCASCDGPLFGDMDVVVVGGGNAGFETAAQLLEYAKSVTLLHRSDQFKADEITVNKVLENENMTAMKNTEPTEVFGEAMVQGITYKNKETGEEGTINANGVFVEIGQIPNTDYLKDLDGIQFNEFAQIEIDPWTQKTGVKNIWAAGDCTTVKYHQNNIAAGDGVRALEDAYLCLRAQ